MWFEYDEDEWVTVTRRTPCTACNDHKLPCRPGRCNGGFGMSQERRPAAEVAKIKAERQRWWEDAILAEADAIRARRGPDQ